MKCPSCGFEAPATSPCCDACGQSLIQTASAHSPGRSSDSNEFWAWLIPYRNAGALVGYYCAVFSLMPMLGFPFGVAAIVLGT